jgi:hypothetical protein
MAHFSKSQYPNFLKFIKLVKMTVAYSPLGDIFDPLIGMQAYESHGSVGNIP